MDIEWQYRPEPEKDLYTKAQLVDLSVERFLFGELSFIEMIWTWLWIWLGVIRDEDDEKFYYSESVFAFSPPEYNIAASMESGPMNACDWYEWVVAFPSIGYAIRKTSNY